MRFFWLIFSVDRSFCVFCMHPRDLHHFFGCVRSIKSPERFIGMFRFHPFVSKMEREINFV
jgi:hypothetical protein